MTAVKATLAKKLSRSQEANTDWRAACRWGGHVQYTKGRSYRYVHILTAAWESDGELSFPIVATAKDTLDSNYVPKRVRGLNPPVVLGW